MTLSIEDLPAPFGPMMARISRSRTSNETSCSALTPPKASDTPSTARMAGPVPRSATGVKTSSRPPHGGGVVDPGLGDAQIRRDDPGAAILEAHLRLDEAMRLPGVQRLDQRGVLLGDVAPAHLARASELAVVGIELLLQDDETVNLRIAERGVGGEVAVH